MGVEVDMQTAWNWLANTAWDARKLIDDKISRAKTNEYNVRKKYVGSPRLNGQQRERMAVMAYGEGATGDVDRQYYIPQCSVPLTPVANGNFQCNGGTWTWIVNPKGKGN